MGKFFDNDYNEVEAFTQEELDAKLKEAKESWAKESDVDGAKTKLSEYEKQIEDLNAKYEKVSKLNDEKKKSIEDLKKALDNKDTNINSVSDEKRKAFEKMRDTRIEKLVGEDKEYGEALKNQFERIGRETLDPDEIEQFIKESHVLALNQLNREITPFNPGNMSGDAPVAQPQEDVERKQRVDALADYATGLMGIKKQ
jgi:chromosome segregation ATPase